MYHFRNSAFVLTKTYGISFKPQFVMPALKLFIPTLTMNL